MTEKLLAKVWRDTLYRSHICLLVGPADKAMTWLNTHCEVPLDYLEEEDWEVGGRTLQTDLNGDYGIVIWMPSFNLKDTEDMITLAHECFHAAEFSLRDAGVTFIKNVNEPYAYYIGWVFGECLKRLKKR